MTSYIADIIKSHPDNWMGFMREKYPKIHIKEEKPYAIFKYGIGADFRDPVVKEARGIIINTQTAEVVCWPFTKFTNFDDYYADLIDWETAVVQEKIDGSIIKLWFDPIREEWRFSTDFCIDANDAICPNPDESGKYLSFLDIIHMCDTYTEICNRIETNGMNKEWTYIFELTSAYNRVVVDYDRPPMLFHTGLRNNKTGEEYSYKLFTFTPKTFPLRTVADCMASFKSCTAIENCTEEGYVVVDKYFHRIKVKSDIYGILHDIKNIGMTKKQTLIKMLINGQLNVSALSRHFPEVAHILKYYDFKVAEWCYQVKYIVELARNIYNDCIQNGYTDKLARKEVALVLMTCHTENSNGMQYMAFISIRTNKTFEELVEEKPIFLESFCDRIPKYDSVKLPQYGIWKKDFDQLLNGGDKK